MEHLRKIEPGVCTREACCSCHSATGRWDRLAGKPFCPHCQEALALGEAAPFVQRTQRRPCAVCHKTGTVTFGTFPLDHEELVEIDLCSEHLRALLGRSLGPHGFHQLRRQLRSVNLEVEDIFLLHDAFYNRSGKALQPTFSD